MPMENSFYRSFDGRPQTQNEKPQVPATFLNDLISSFIEQGEELDEYFDVWAFDDYSPQEIKDVVKMVTGLEISMGEAEYLFSISDQIRQDEDMKNFDMSSLKEARVAPLTKRNLKELIKVSSSRYKHRYANIMWQVKAMVGDDGAERFFLVRLEPETSN